MFTVYFFQIVSINILKNPCFIETQYPNLDFKEKNFAVRICIKVIKVDRWNLSHLLLIYEISPDFTLT